jgi:hypothetical protein
MYTRQDEIAELRRRLGISAHQIDLLKQEVAARDHTLQKEKYDHEKVRQLLSCCRLHFQLLLRFELRAVCYWVRVTGPA